MIADASQISYIHGFAPFLTPQRVCSRAAFTQTLLHTDAFTHRSLSTEKPFLKKPYHMKPLHRAALHTDAFSQRSFYTEELNAQMPKLLHTGAFAHTRLTQRSF